MIELPFNLGEPLRICKIWCACYFMPQMLVSTTISFFFLFCSISQVEITVILNFIYGGILDFPNKADAGYVSSYVIFNCKSCLLCFLPCTFECKVQHRVYKLKKVPGIPFKTLPKKVVVGRILYFVAELWGRTDKEEYMGRGGCLSHVPCLVTESPYSLLQYYMSREFIVYYCSLLFLIPCSLTVFHPQTMKSHPCPLCFAGHWAWSV